MKRIRAFAMALVMVLSLAACGGGKDETTPIEEDTAAQEETASAGEETTSTKEGTAAGEDEAESSEPEEGEESKEEESTPASKTETLPEGPPTYTFDAATGTLTCSGGGKVVQKDWLDIVKNTLFETDNYKAMLEVKKVIVEQGVTSLGDGAFMQCKNLTEVVLPDTLTRIEEFAFADTALTGITIPESVTELGDCVFEQCSNLTSVNLPGGLTKIPAGLFRSCTNLTSIEIPKGVTRIEGEAFSWTGLTELTIPEGLTDIESDFISYSSVTSVTLPSSLTKWANIFDDASQLTDVTILCEVTMDNVDSLVGRLMKMPVTIHAPAGSVIEGYVNRQIQNGNAKCTFAPI